MNLISSPGPDSSRLAPVSLDILRTEPAAVPAPPPRVTPTVAPLPAPNGTWLEEQLQKVQDAIATGRSEATRTEAEARAIKSQVESIGILGGLDQTLTDVRRAGQLQQMLPLVVLAIGIVVGRPVLGALAAAVVWFAGRES